MYVCGTGTAGSPHGARGNIQSAPTAKYKLDQVRHHLSPFPDQITARQSGSIHIYSRI